MSLGGGMALEPVLPWPVVAVAVLVGLGGAAVAFWRRPRQRRTWLARAAVVALVGLALLGPHVGTATSSHVHRPAAQVVVALDRTASMAVRDADSGASRWEQALADLDALVAAEPDASFGLVTWADDARLAVPLTTDAEALASVADAAGTQPPREADGSRLDRPLATLDRVVRRTAAAHPDRETFLLVLSDGEDTEPGPARPWERLVDVLGGGAVVGYGSERGGPVPLGRGAGLVPDPDGPGPAVSRRGDSSLEQVADDLEVDYLPRERLAGVEELAAAVRPEPREVTGPGTARDVTWVVGLLLLLLVAAEVRASSAAVRELRSTRRPA